MSVRLIATNLCISASTVSLALRSSPKISSETRERVLREARRIGYRPNARLNEFMSQLRVAGVRPTEACIGVVSLYDALRPWEKSEHLGRIYTAMRSRADALGYRLEPICMRAAGMTYDRIRSILDCRGIKGLLCFGSPEFGSLFPKELDHYSIVTQGLSIKTPLNRVTSHFYSDLHNTLDRVYERGYRRPGLILGRYEDDRSASAYASAYFGWCEHVLGRPEIVPILRLDEVESKPILDWIGEQKPDVIVFTHVYDRVQAFKRAIAPIQSRVPHEIGVAVVSQILEGSGFSGMQQNQDLMGQRAVELLIARIMNQDFGFPQHPRLEMVESCWVEGDTLRRLDA